MILRSAFGDVTEDRDVRGWWLARPTGDDCYTSGFRSACAATAWMRAIAHAEAAGLPRPPVPAASTAPLFRAAGYTAPASDPLAARTAAEMAALDAFRAVPIERQAEALRLLRRASAGEMPGRAH